MVPSPFLEFSDKCNDSSKSKDKRKQNVEDLNVLSQRTRTAKTAPSKFELHLKAKTGK